MIIDGQLRCDNSQVYTFYVICSVRRAAFSRVKKCPIFKMLQCVKSRKRNDLLVRKDVVYCRERSGTKVIWKCIEYFSDFKCHARVHTLDGKVVPSTMDVHNHDPDPMKNEERKNINNLKEESGETEKITNAVISGFCLHLHELGALVFLPPDCVEYA